MNVAIYFLILAFLISMYRAGLVIDKEVEHIVKEDRWRDFPLFKWVNSLEYMIISAFFWVISILFIVFTVGCIIKTLGK